MLFAHFCQFGLSFYNLVDLVDIYSPLDIAREKISKYYDDDNFVVMF